MSYTIQFATPADLNYIEYNEHSWSSATGQDAIPGKLDLGLSWPPPTYPDYPYIIAGTEGEGALLATNDTWELEFYIYIDDSSTSANHDRFYISPLDAQAYGGSATDHLTVGFINRTISSSTVQLQARNASANYSFVSPALSRNTWHKGRVEFTRFATYVAGDWIWNDVPYVAGQAYILHPTSGKFYITSADAATTTYMDDIYSSVGWKSLLTRILSSYYRRLRS